MNFRIILLSIILSGYFAQIFPQTYYQGDVNALKSIDANCDGQNILNWNTEADPSAWIGVVWDNNNPKRVSEVIVSNKQLTNSLDVTDLTQLTRLSCGSNQLTSLDASNLVNLTYLSCLSNNLVTLYTTGLANLEYLYCDYNQITTLDISESTKLIQLYCRNNQLTSLNIATLTNLTVLNCRSNLLTSLDVSSLTKLTELRCEINRLPFSSLAGGLDVLTFSYYPQDTLYTSREVEENITLDYSAEALIRSSATTFKFYKDNILVETNNTGLYTTTGSGKYYCKMTNALISANNFTQKTAVVSVTLFSLSVSETNLDIGYTDGSTTGFDIYSNTLWNVSSSETWLSANPESGSGNNSVTLTADANTSDSPRSATVTVSGEGIPSPTITVIQLGAATIHVINIEESASFIYPNPANNMLYIKGSQGFNLKIVDIQGVEVLNKSNLNENEEVDLSEIPSGVYFITTEKKQMRFIKE